MFRMLIHPSSGACDLFVELFHGLYCSGSMCVGVTLWFGCSGEVSVCRLRHYYQDDARYNKHKIHTLRLCTTECFSAATMVAQTHLNVTLYLYCPPCYLLKRLRMYGATPLLIYSKALVMHQNN